MFKLGRLNGSRPWWPTLMACWIHTDGVSKDMRLMEAEIQGLAWEQNMELNFIKSRSWLPSFVAGDLKEQGTYTELQEPMEVKIQD